MEQNKTGLSADLNLVYSTMPSGLLNQEGYSRLSALLDMLPAALTNFWGLECRLNEQAPLADMLLEIKRGTPGHKLLAGHSSSAVDDLCRDYPIWRETRSFAQQWLCAETLINRHVLNLWLEFDTEKALSCDDAIGLIGQPSVFLGFSSAQLPMDELRELLNEAASFLKISKDTQEKIVSLIKSIPPTGQLFQLGSMLGRPGKDTRLCFNKLSPGLIPQWLSNSGWHGNTQVLTETLGMLDPLVRALAIDLNLTETGISDKIGIECYVDWSERNTDLWAYLLDRLKEYIHIHPSKHSGLLLYPAELSLPISRRKDSGLNLLLFKMLHHIKLGFHGNTLSDAKAYLAIYRPGIQPDNHWLVE